MKNFIENATSLDLSEILRIDREVVGDQIDRAEEINLAVQTSECRIIVSNSVIVAFAITARESYKRMDFLKLLVVHPAHRRLGHATSLLFDFQLNATTPFCWTSTNRSNSEMIRLLRKLEWADSGYKEELDVDDPDLFFSYDRKRGPLSLEE